MTLDRHIAHLFPGPQLADVRDRPRFQVRDLVTNGSARRTLADGLRAYLDSRRALGYERLIVGLSGGIDSAVSAQLAYDAVGERAQGAIIDFGDTSRELDVAQSIAERVGIPFTMVNGRDVYDAHRSVVAGDSVISRIHARSRLITSLLHQLADNCDGLVIDTTDRSERILCLYEEGVRGNVAPLGELFKTELYEMARAMGFSELAPSGCPELNNFDAFGLEWPELDAVLDAVTRGVSLAEVAQTHRVESGWLAMLADRIELQPLRTIHVRLSIGR